eukprot:382190-Amphidinium_carterae.2
MVAELRLIRRETTIADNNFSNENKIEENNTVTLQVHVIDDNTVGMMGRMNIKLPTPTQLGGKSPQFN